MKLKTIVPALCLLHVINTQSISNRYSIPDFPQYETCLDRSVTPAHQTNCLYETLHESETMYDNALDQRRQQLQELNNKNKALKHDAQQGNLRAAISTIVGGIVVLYGKGTIPFIIGGAAIPIFYIVPTFCRGQESVNELSLDCDILSQNENRLDIALNDITTLNDILLRRPANEISSPFE